MKFLFTDEGIFDVTRAQKYLDAPDIDLQDLKLRKCEDIEGYFSDILSGFYCIHAINEYSTSKITRLPFCDSCGNKIEGHWIFCKRRRVHLCSECSKDSESSTIVEKKFDEYAAEIYEDCLENGLESEDDLVEIQQVLSWFDFGSLLDWIPLFTDDDYSTVLMNLNPESRYCGQLAFMECDSDGRRVCHSFPDANIKDVLKHLRRYSCIRDVMKAKRMCIE